MKTVTYGTYVSSVKVGDKQITPPTRKVTTQENGKSKDRLVSGLGFEYDMQKPESVEEAVQLSGSLENFFAFFWRGYTLATQSPLTKVLKDVFLAESQDQIAKVKADEAQTEESKAMAIDRTLNAACDAANAKALELIGMWKPGQPLPDEFKSERKVGVAGGGEMPLKAQATKRVIKAISQKYNMSKDAYIAQYGQGKFDDSVGKAIAQIERERSQATEELLAGV